MLVAMYGDVILSVDTILVQFVERNDFWDDIDRPHALLCMND